MASTSRRRRPGNAPRDWPASDDATGATSPFPVPGTPDGPWFASVAALIALGTLALAPSDVAASEGEATVWVAADAANASDTTPAGPQFGVGAQTGISFGVSDFWTLNLGTEAAFHPSVSPGDDQVPSLFVHNLFGGFRYNLDIFTYVPYVKLAAVAYTAAPLVDAGGQRPAVGAKMTVGVDWRFDRNWSLGGMAELHTVSFDVGNFPSYSSVGVRLTHHFRL